MKFYVFSVAAFAVFAGIIILFNDCEDRQKYLVFCISSLFGFCIACAIISHNEISIRKQNIIEGITRETNYALLDDLILCRKELDLKEQWMKRLSERIVQLQWDADAATKGNEIYQANIELNKKVIQQIAASSKSLETFSKN